ncbi:hypothetical protein LXA43DRAFT_1089375 [Ganoderma leucocontextum]|nr:hypothetical protein LXA43DRAFT_1089375 [Ganoderma leucocontextum]
MARTVYPVASSTRGRRHNAASNPLLGIPARPVVDPVHLPATAQTTPAFHVGQKVGVQLREYIWVPGTILSAQYFAQYASVVYKIQYVAADGCWRREGFFPKDVRAHE